MCYGNIYDHYSRRDQTENNPGDEKPQLEKNTKRSLKKLKKKLKPQTKKWVKAKKKTPKQKKAAAQAESEKTEAEAKEAEGVFSEIEVKNDVATVREADEEHPGHRTANEEAGLIVLRVEQDMDERKKTAISNEGACREEGEVMTEQKREETNEQ